MKRAAVLVLAACSSTPTPIRIDSAEPDHGPLAGGTRIVVTGDRFVDGEAGPARVLVGGRQSELASAIDDETIELVLPPGERPGEVELVVFNNNGVAISTTAFHYADLPAIAAVSPGEILFDAPATTMTVTGSGFLDDSAGATTVFLDDEPAENVVVTSDTTLTFTAPAGRALSRPRLELANARGTALEERAFRYRPSMRPGLLLFARSSNTFATFFEPVDKTLTPIPRVGPFFTMSTVILDADGEYRAIDPHSQLFGRLDLSTQRFEQTIPVPIHASAMVRIDGMQFAIDRNTQQFGKFGSDGEFTRIGTSTFPCCGSNGIAYDGTTLYFTYRSGIDKFINTLDRATGIVGTPVKLVGNGNFHVEEMRFFGGKLYATSRDSTLVEIDPVTGVVTVVASILRANAMEALP
jgi:IPT/TIG domain